MTALERPPRLIFLYGPPAVGKLTVARAIAERRTPRAAQPWRALMARESAAHIERDMSLRSTLGLSREASLLEGGPTRGCSEAAQGQR